MTDRDKLPAKTGTGHAVVPTQQSGSLVTRGLEFVQNRKTKTPSYPEKLFRDAADAWKRGDIAEAVKLARPAADQGNGRAQELLGAIYSLSGDETRDYVLAHMWYNLAATNLPGADYFWMRDDAIKSRDWVAKMMTPEQVSEAERLAHGWKSKELKTIAGAALPLQAISYFPELKRDVPEVGLDGILNYRKAAERGDATAQYFLGEAYYEGDGVSQNYTQAVKWWRKAAEQGSGAAQYRLGCAYANGEGAPQDYVYAHMSFTLSNFTAGPKGFRTFFNPAADQQIEHLESFMTEGEISKAQTLVREWTETHAS